MKVAIYVRVSTNEQTTLNQELELREYCKRNNYEIFNIYKDEGISGAKTTRPELDNMLQDMRKKLFEAILPLTLLFDPTIIMPAQLLFDAMLFESVELSVSQSSIPTLV